MDLNSWKGKPPGVRRVVMSFSVPEWFFNAWQAFCDKNDIDLQHRALYEAARLLDNREKLEKLLQDIADRNSCSIVSAEDDHLFLNRTWNRLNRILNPVRTSDEECYTMRSHLPKEGG
jgi:hypothetical protein